MKTSFFKNETTDLRDPMGESTVWELTVSGLPILELAAHSPVPGEVLTRLGALSLGAYSLGAYSVRATDFGGGNALTRSWKSTHSTGSLESGSLHSGSSLGAYSLGAYSVRATDFGAAGALTRS